jgi:hypothetical protein
MTNILKFADLSFRLAAGLSLILLPACTVPAQSENLLKQAKIIIEHNATDKDTGFQIFFDAEGWDKMSVTGPNGKIAEFLPQGSVNELGMTELFLETVEPENAKVPLAETLKKMPEGNYEFVATNSRMSGFQGTMKGMATLSHRIPEGVKLLAPKEGTSVPLGAVKLAWKGTGKAIDGSDVKVIAQQLIVEKDEEPHPKMIGKRGLSMYLAAGTTEVEIPKVFFESGTPYFWEVLVIEEGGNQTLQSGSFRIQ